ncbi:MAG: HigA family addiction module antidote protein [Treponema sp.]|nr:HigA family addiction module antidote protein [Treponema sp.]
MEMVDKKKDIEIVYPGRILKTYFMEPLGISGYKLAKEIGVPRITISNIVNNKRGISTDISLRLSKYFGNSAEFWLNLQQHYELELGRERAKEVLENIIPFNKNGNDVRANRKNEKMVN